MFRHAGLGKKIGFGFAIVLSALIVVVVVGAMRLHSGSVAIDDVATVHVKLLLAADAIDAAATEQELAATLTAIHIPEREELIGKFDELMTTVDENVAAAHDIIGTDEELVKRGWKQQIDAIAELHDAFVAKGRDLIKATATSDRNAIEEAGDTVRAASAQLMERIDAFLAENEEEMTRVVTTARTDAHSATTLLVGVGAGAVVLGVLLALFITRSITKPIKRIVADLSEGANQLDSASQQVSQSSQQLAGASSEQAASLEEVSSALQDITTSTRSGAENAGKVSERASASGALVRAADTDMAETAGAMQEISDASAQISKILKAIEDIAFQTNLLALNAAVEAARAGEHGKGFAVVAEEVRALAQRAADAARETGELVGLTVSRVEKGVAQSHKSADNFSSIGANIQEMIALIQTIASVSDQQAHGVASISSSVEQMNAVTQETAAGAEEAASAAEELSAQSQVVRTTVATLTSLIQGGPALHTT
ncbi:MAG: hypothetical protein H6816_03595 [Phycisphaerales bacterium]|nr:hypothetical protein [Phycisphaerales bacterium]